MLLLNGCSYGDAWKSFPGYNLSRAGGSFYRSIRTTMEWIATNGKPDWVFIPITFATRIEISRIDVDQRIEGAYDINDDSHAVHQRVGSQISDSCYGPWDYLFMNAIMFGSWLDQQNVKYLMWDQCNNFDSQHMAGFRAFKKLKYLEGNPRIVPLFEFCGNQYMYDSGGKWKHDDDREVPASRHYDDESYTFLKQYLDDYVKKTLNEKVDW